ncbi:MAG: hypothetical protein FWG57_03725 [Endomicrobia bacterium]|nr:hypothetical protein [Endomicrobiia bacterium]
MQIPPPYKVIHCAPQKPFLKNITLYKLRPDRFLRSIRYRLQNIVFDKQKNVSFGEEYPDKTFYVIREKVGTIDGLGTIMCNVSEHIAYAKEKGYIPVIEDKKIDNSWEIKYSQYFEQPEGYGTKDISKAKNVILSKRMTPSREFSLLPDICIAQNKERLEYFRGIFKRYIHFNKETENYLNADFNRIVSGKKNILGCLVRGTDYTINKPSGHHIQPEIEDAADKADKVMQSYNCSFIYLATESEKVYELFKRRFNSKLLVNGQKRYSAGDTGKKFRFISEISSRRVNDRYLTNLEYMSSINILSKCDCFVGGLTNGTAGAYLMSCGFKYDYVFDLGVYQ